MNHGIIIARNAIWLIAQRLAMGIISIFVISMLARYLGTERYGLLVLMLSYVALFTPLGVLGLRPYSVRLIAADPGSAAAIVGEMLSLRFCLSLLAILAAAAYGRFADHTMPPVLLELLLAQLLLNTMANCFIDGLYGAESIKAVATVMAISGVLVQAASLGAVLCDLGLVGAASAYLVGSVAMLAAGWHYFRREAGTLRLRLPNRKGFRHLWESRTFFYQNLVVTLRNRIDVVVVTHLLGAHAAGLYGSANTLIQRIDFISDGLSTALFSRVSSMHSRARDDVAQLVRIALKVAMVVSVPMGLGLSVVAEPVTLLVFGEEFRASSVPLSILALSIPCTFTAGVMFNVLQAMQRQDSVFHFSVASTLAAAVFLPGGTILGGLAGAALGLLLTHATFAISLVASYWKTHGAPLGGTDAARLVAANVLMLLTLWILQDERLALKIIGSAAIYGSAILALRLVTFGMVKSMLRDSAAGNPSHGAHDG